jgi:hypothetical protein
MDAAQGARYSRDEPCPICGGYPTMAKGRGVRCWGFSIDRALFCTRDEHAGQAPFHAGANAFQHNRYGECRCGGQHGEDAPEPVYWNPAPRAKAPADEPERPPRPDPDTLARICQRYCELSPLRDDHRRHLAKRGKADLDAGERFGYASLPRGYSEARKPSTPWSLSSAKKRSLAHPASTAPSAMGGYRPTPERSRPMPW